MPNEKAAVHLNFPQYQRLKRQKKQDLKKETESVLWEE